MLLKLRERMSSEKGFTLIELLVVMLIIGILAAIAIPTFFNQRNKASDSSSKEMAHTAQIAAETIATDNNGSYTTVAPGTLAAIDASVRTAPGSPPKPYVSAASGTRQVDRDRHLLDREHVLDRQGDRHGRSDVSLHRFRDRQRWLSEQRLLGLTQLAESREARRRPHARGGRAFGPTLLFAGRWISLPGLWGLKRLASSPTPGYGLVDAGCRFKVA